MSRELTIYNSLTRKQERFEPIQEGKVGFYLCGPTVYDSAHIGHARPAVVFDVIRRFLERLGYDVTFVMNITDVDDKVINRAAERGADWRELAKVYTQEYLEDMDGLGVRRADHNPRATEHIEQMIKLVETLEERDFAYDVDGDVYYHVPKRGSEYGKLSGRRPDDEDTESRVEHDERKKHRADFALWKKAPPEEPGWKSPWGHGRPGWHLECSVMSAEYLGQPFDIHAGGMDLLFPHHENEIAQSEAAHDETFAKYWLHNGFINNAKGEKISKTDYVDSLKLRKMLEDYDPATLRYFILGTHYRGPIAFLPPTDDDPGSLAAAMAAMDRIYTALENMQGSIAAAGAGNDKHDSAIREGAKKLVADFDTAMCDDFNTPRALAAIFDAVKVMNINAKGASTGANEAILSDLLSCMDVLGIPAERPVKAVGGNEPALIELLIDVRNLARKAKQFEIADQVRDRLGELGYQLEDGPDGTKWKQL